MNVLTNQLLSRADAPRPLPRVPWHMDGSERDGVKDAYLANAKEYIPDLASDLVAAHLEIVATNLDKRLAHVPAAHRYNAYGNEVVKIIGRDNKDYRSQMQSFINSRTMPSFEVFSRLDAAEQPARISTALAEKAFETLAADSGAMIISDRPRTRLKVTRIIPFNGELDAAVVAVKTDKLTLEKDNTQHIDVKTREAGFVLLDDRLDPRTATAFKALGAMRSNWDKYYDEGSIGPFRDQVMEVLSEEELYHPAITTLFLARQRHL